LSGRSQVVPSLRADASMNGLRYRDGPRRSGRAASAGPCSRVWPREERHYRRLWQAPGSIG
jgi:hypothetical protein